ncbi:MAG TPA: YHS domain-containing protein [Sedimentisphaerales bacterium]|nr:YHS domain-containing protein [Sedimentisphaerales bacterium]
MNSKKKQLITMLLLAELLLAGSVFVYGCKKSEPAPAAPAAPTAAQVAEDAASQVVQAVEQTECPVMGGAINKALFTEYKGKKVYFCCDGCKEKFEAAPEQYIAKLPQFKQ